MVGIKDIPFFKNLSEAEIKVIQSCLLEKSFNKGQVLHGEGTDCERVFFVRLGRVKLYRTSSSGREQIFEILNPGDTCACNPGELSWHCGTTAEALTDCTVWFLSRGQYIQLVKNNSKLMQALNGLFARKIQCFGNLIEEVTLKDARKRLVKFLLDIPCNKKQGMNALLTTFTQEEIANRLGTSRETITRQISYLRRKKIIDVKPHEIIILNRQALEKIIQ